MKTIDTDIVIVGSGISGVAVAWSLLKNTNKRIVMLEAGPRVRMGGLVDDGGVGPSNRSWLDFVMRGLKEILIYSYPTNYV